MAHDPVSSRSVGSIRRDREEGDVPICVSCGADNPDGARYCEECGVELGRATSPDTHPDEVVEDSAVPGAASATERAQQSPVPGETRAAGDAPVPPEDPEDPQGPADPA